MADRRKLIQKCLQRIPFLDEIKKVLDWNACAVENGYSALDFRIDIDKDLGHGFLSSADQAAVYRDQPAATASTSSFQRGSSSCEQTTVNATRWAPRCLTLISTFASSYLGSAR